MAKKSVSLSDVQMLVKLLTPAPVAPILQNYSGDHDLIQRVDQKVDAIQADVSELKKSRDFYVTQSEHSDLTKLVADHEIRVRKNTNDITKIQTWGAALIVLVGIAEALITIYFHTK